MVAATSKNSSGETLRSTWSEQISNLSVRFQMWKSWTEITPWTFKISSMTSSESIDSGVPCNRILDDDLQSGSAEEKMMHVIIREMSGSAVSVFVEQEEPRDVGDKSTGTNYQYKLRICDVLGCNKPLDSLDEDGEAQGKQEHGVDECSQDFCTLPAVGELSVRLLGLGNINGPKRHQQRDDIIQHVERICNQGKRVDSVSDDDFQKEKDGVDPQQSEDLDFFLGHTPGCTVALVVAAADLVEAVLLWVDLAGVTIALVAVVARQTNTKRWLLVLERRRVLKVNRIPADLGKRVSAVVHVEAGNVWRPVAVRVAGGAPLTSFFGRNPWRVDVEVRGSASPVISAWHGKRLRRRRVDVGWNQHLLVSRQDGLAECNVFRGRVLHRGSALAIDTVVVVRDWRLELAIVVAVKSSFLGARVAVGGDFWIPLCHQLSRRTGVRTVVARGAGLVLGPAATIDVGDFDETLVGRERTLCCSLLVRVVDVLDGSRGGKHSKSEKD
ncbi:hypothetical protein OGATHE_004655 [Ogataea polymorpha]|uniref:Uncharacterized protein n=1 Tax=Ogataea polymorpha TaxID=460523 RepID=A0A9P8T2D8_9ASCO|nr:hypothetical protein OGATHE_004655 [Ogataea polymorpha]